MSSGFVVHNGTRFSILHDMETFRSAVENHEEVAISIPFEEYGVCVRVLPHTKLFSRVHTICRQCGRCLVHAEILDLIRISAKENESPLSTDRVVRPRCCEVCGSQDALLVADVAPLGQIKETDRMALKVHWEACAQSWMRQSSRDRYRCDTCYAEIQPGTTAYLGGSWLYCGDCADKTFSEYAEHTEDPDYYGLGSWRSARNFIGWRYLAFSKAFTVGPSEIEPSVFEAEIRGTFQKHISRVLAEPSLAYAKELLPAVAVEGLAAQASDQIINLLPDGEIHEWFAYELFEKAIYTVTCFLGSIAEFRSYLKEQTEGFFGFQAKVLNAIRHDNVYGRDCPVHVHPIIGYTGSYLWTQLFVGSSDPRRYSVAQSLLPIDLLLPHELGHPKIRGQAKDSCAGSAPQDESADGDGALQGIDNLRKRFTSMISSPDQQIAVYGSAARQFPEFSETEVLQYILNEYKNKGK